FLFLFFFQAEDGIRDFHVTGVQTCALPIWKKQSGKKSKKYSTRMLISRAILFIIVLLTVYGLAYLSRMLQEALHGSNLPLIVGRSEERRVGKECRVEWSGVHRNKREG